MPSKWQVWGQPDGSIVWLPVSDAPPNPPRPGPLRPAPRHPPLPDEAPIEETLCPDTAGGCRISSMADLLLQAREQLIEGDAMDGLAQSVNTAGLFSTGSGRPLAVSQRAVRRASALVGEEVDEATDNNNKKRKKPFGCDAGLEGELANLHVPFGGGVHKDNFFPMFQSGSGKAVLLNKDSIQKARAVLEENVENAAGAKQPMFHTSTGRSVLVSKSSIDKARAVLGGRMIAHEGDVGGVDGMEQFPVSQAGSGNVEGPGRPANQSLIFQTSSGRPVLISKRYVERSRALLMDEDVKNIRQWDTGCQLPIFQTGLGRPVAVKHSSIKKASTILGDGDVKRSGNGHTGVCTTPFQFETPKSVLMSSSLIINGMTVTPEENTSVRAEKCFNDDGQLPLFQTGSGRSVTASKGSFKRASSVLEPRNIAKELEDESHLNDGYATSIFKTGLGKSILPTENSRERAQFVLEAKEAVKQVISDIGAGFGENPMFHSGKQQFSPENDTSRPRASTPMEQGKFATKGYEDCGSPLPMFQTGSGKSVLVCESSMQKARAVLEEEEHYKLVKMDKKIAASASPLKTSHARTVNISSTGVSRAATLLGLEENTLSTQFFGHVSDKLGTEITVKRGNPEHMLDVASAHAISSGTHKGFIYPTENPTHMDKHQQFGFSKSSTSYVGEHSIRFSTAGGRSMAISVDALQRAKSLLGDSDLVVSPNGSIGRSLASAIENLPKPTISPKGDVSNLSYGTRAIGYAVPDTPVTKTSANQFHMGREYRPVNEIPKVPKPPSRCLSEGDNASNSKDKTQWHHMPAGPLVDITNYMATCSGNTDCLANGKRIIGGRNSVSPFKRPRSSRFITPIKNNKLSSAGESIVPPMQISPCRTMLSVRYPFQHQRKNYKEYFGGPPCFKYLTEHVTDDVKLMDARRAEKFRFQHMDTGAEEFQKMLLTCGASLSCATKEWVSNHYKWIVWKLASLERCYPTRVAGKFLTVDNVLEELKYRYDREVNHGHRSAIKKILEGNSSPSLMMVLCISAIYSCPYQNNNKLEVNKVDTNEDNSGNQSFSATNRNMSANIELTDGWYSLDASLDVALLEQLEKRKLFVGQKLRIWGASLCGWSGPVSFHEVSGVVKLVVHINGTYRARWNDALGFCKHVGLPLAFRCIKVSGGRVPRTLVGITRIYPILYRERLPDGRFVVRSERMERKALELYHQRVSKITEDILFEQQENCDSTDDNEEGATICKMLEHAAEPEFILAGMTPEQLKCFSSYIEKQKIVKQNEVSEKVEKALVVAGLSSRDVTPFLKVRVIGLVNKHSASTSSNKEGLITIWNPTEMQKDNLVEGQAYSVMGLVPSNYCTEIMYLHARGSSTTWKPLASAQTTDFKAIELLKFGEVPISSEFDIAGLILYVGNTYLCNNKKKQWLFLTDGSKFVSGQGCEEQDCLLAVSFSSATTDEDSTLFSYTLSGNTVGFSNLVKRQKDETRQVWVAEATESSSYTLSNEIPRKSHLKEAAVLAERWASRSYHKIQELKERVLCIVGNAGV
ncbi:protein BREAST CANCER SUSCEPTIBILITY 2 homolog A isoform X11 [Zea mays]|uniref:Protein BREAST CANCER SUSCEPTIBILITY 2 homolog B n=1 Tax=Zea mays TaxID=4577 RepID=A0A1D6J344_MAIZE|nr:protein BREAST CANCER SUSCEPTIBILITY 2 homolog A isoform X11 [Zea mays]AQK42453.1 Protein BREAST CANCER SUSCEPTIBILITY 2 homolog B [Zea mays]|eukprot:XP_020401385.1 protein BREAST CANCER SUSCEPTIBILITY 2 homolog A isoform X9 [Zea mays]